MLYEGINTLCFSCGRIGHKLESCPYTIREHPNEQNVEHNTRPTDTQNAQRVDGTREVGKMQEDYGEWMVVSRRKTNNKTRNKQHSLELSQSMEPSPMQTSIAKPRVAVQSRKDGKRKALHT